MKKKNVHRINKSIDKKKNALKKIQQDITMQMEEAKKIRDELWRLTEEKALKNRFRTIVEPVSTMGEILNNYKFPFASKKKYKGSDIAELKFCGYLEGDYSERYLKAPVSYSGGFFLRFLQLDINILFDPGNGTINGMRDLKVNLAEDTDIVIVSHYHPSARLDLHTICNELGGYCPGRSGMIDNDGEKARGHHLSSNVVLKDEVRKKVTLFSSSALIHGRAGHPPVLIPSDEKVIHQKIVARSRQYWEIKKKDNVCNVIPKGEFSDSDITKILNECAEETVLLMAFPAYHLECIEKGQDWDNERLKEKHVSCFFLYCKGAGIFFTGDSEYRDTWQTPLQYLKDKVTILIANMKTIEYLPKLSSSFDVDKNDWPHLNLTKNQMGYEGTRRLSCLLDPKVLVIRALGLECVTEEKDGDLVYNTQKLAVIQESMHYLLKEKKCRTEHVIIPGRHRIRLKQDLEIDQKALVPAFAPMRREYGSPEAPYLCGSNVELASHIDDVLRILEKDDSKKNEKPYIVIVGDTGIGKSHLAESMAIEVVSPMIVRQCQDIFWDILVNKKEEANKGIISRRTIVNKEIKELTEYRTIKIDQKDKRSSADFKKVMERHYNNWTVRMKILNMIERGNISQEKIRIIIKNMDMADTDRQKMKSRAKMMKANAPENSIKRKIYEIIERSCDDTSISDSTPDTVRFNYSEIKDFIQTYDLATIEKDSTHFNQNFFGYIPGAYGAYEDSQVSKGHPGQLSNKGGVLILNQLESLPDSEGKKLLDLLERWKFNLEEDTTMTEQDVNVKIIFTTNIDIDDTELREDIKNRLRGRILELPSMKKLEETGLYQAHIMDFIRNWSMRQDVLFDAGSYELLLETDLSHGAMRYLNAVLHRAKQLVESRYRLNEAENMTIFITKVFVKEAIALSRPKDKDVGGILKEKMGKAAGAVEYKYDVTPEYLWRLTIWLSYKCVQKNTHKTFQTDALQAEKQYYIAIPTFKKIMKQAVKSFDLQPLDLWNLFDDPNALEALFHGTDPIVNLKNYVTELARKCDKRISSQAVALTKWFAPTVDGAVSNTDVVKKWIEDVPDSRKFEDSIFQDWLRARSTALKENMSENMKNKTLDQFRKKIQSLLEN